MSDSHIPNFRRLVEALCQLRQTPDSTGWTRITSEEADRIKQCGFDARPGSWRTPTIPLEIAGQNDLALPWVYLSPKVAPSDTVAEPKPAGTEALAGPEGEGITARDDDYPAVLQAKDQAAILHILAKTPGGKSLKRQVQRKLSRTSACRLNAAIASLTQQRVIVRERSWLCLTSNP